MRRPLNANTYVHLNMASFVRFLTVLVASQHVCMPARSQHSCLPVKYQNPSFQDATIPQMSLFIIVRLS